MIAVYALLAVLVVLLGCASGELPVEVPPARSELLEAPDSARVPFVRGVAAPAHPHPSAEASLSDSTVRIEVFDSDRGAYRVGSGLVLCQQGTSVHVLTALHVLTGEDAGAGKRGSEALFGASEAKVTVHFGGRRAPPVNGTVTSLQAFPAEVHDLALLDVPLPEDITVPPVRIGDAGELYRGAPVMTVGYLRDSDRAWFFEQGHVGYLGELVLYKPAVGEGFSGGPVFDEHGRVVGVNQDVEERDGLTRALPIGTALGFAAERLPRHCTQESLLP